MEGARELPGEVRRRPGDGGERSQLPLTLLEPACLDRETAGKPGGPLPERRVAGRPGPRGGLACEVDRVRREPCRLAPGGFPEQGECAVAGGLPFGGASRVCAAGLEARGRQNAAPGSGR